MQIYRLADGTFKAETDDEQISLTAYGETEQEALIVLGDEISRALAAELSAERSA